MRIEPESGLANVEGHTGLENGEVGDSNLEIRSTLDTILALSALIHCGLVTSQEYPSQAKEGAASRRRWQLGRPQTPRALLGSC